MFAEECQKQQPSLRLLGAPWVVLWPCHSLNGENWDVYVECIVIICYEWNLDWPFCIQYFLSNGRTNMKRHTIDHRREKTNVAFKRTKQNMLCQGTLRPDMFFLWMELPNMHGSYKHGQENEGHRTLISTSAQGLVVEQAGLWCVDGRKVGRSRSEIYQNISKYEICLDLLEPKKWKWFPMDSLVDFTLGQ